MEAVLSTVIPITHGNTLAAAVAAALAEKVEAGMPRPAWPLVAAVAASAAKAAAAAKNAAAVAAVSSETARIVYTQMILTSPAVVAACLLTEIRVSAAVAARGETLAPESDMVILPLARVA